MTSPVTPLTVTLGLGAKTISGISKLAEREGISFADMIDRLLSMSSTIAERAERGLIIAFVETPKVHNPAIGIIQGVGSYVATKGTE